ncbi:MAG: hypothetical protein AAFP84_22845, partial [Actinomycetota bacterium]
ADLDLSTIDRLLRPGLLYADEVTLFSPVATMAQVATLLASEDQVERVDGFLTAFDRVPQLRRRIEHRGINREDLHRLRDRVATGSSSGKSDREFAGILAPVSSTLASVLAQYNYEKIDRVITTGRVNIGDLPTLRDSSGNAGPESTWTDDTLSGFMLRLYEIVAEPGTFPLLDEDARDLLQLAENHTGTSLGTMARDTEIALASSVIGHLPSFDRIPLDELLDIRDDNEVPLARFRAAIARLADDFENRPIDSDFDNEVAHAWRTTVNPALLQVRESFAEHGLLREVASVAAGNPTRLLAEAGGVVAASQATFASFPNAVTGLSAVGLPMFDVAIRAFKARHDAAAEIRRSAFYFLHLIGEAASES